MRTLISVVLFAVVYTIVGGQPTRSFCAAPETKDGKGNVNVTVTSEAACTIEGSWTPTGGETKARRRATRAQLSRIIADSKFPAKSSPGAHRSHRASNVVCAIVGNGPTGSYCGAPDTPFGKATFKITVTSSSAFNVEGSWTPTGGETKSVRETGLEYTYEASTGDVTVKSVDKLGDLIKKLGVPISADQLAKLNYKDNTLYVTQLGNYPLKAC